MTKKYYIEKVADKTVIFTEVAPYELAPFKDFKNMDEAVQYCKTVLAKESEKVIIQDIDEEARAIFVKGELSHFNCYYPESEKDMHKIWTGEKLIEEEKIHCSNCRDGGCLYCEPDRFIDGYKNY